MAWIVDGEYRVLMALCDVVVLRGGGWSVSQVRGKNVEIR